MLGHSYALIQFLYASRIMSRATTAPLLFEYLPWVIYTAGIGGLVVFMVKENIRILKKLDSKYTPLWVRLTEEQTNSL